MNDRQSLSITFLDITDQFAFFLAITFDGHFGCHKITFDHISHHFKRIHNFHVFKHIFTKWLPAAIVKICLKT